MNDGVNRKVIVIRATGQVLLAAYCMCLVGLLMTPQPASALNLRKFTDALGLTIPPEEHLSPDGAYWIDEFAQYRTAYAYLKMGDESVLQWAEQRDVVVARRTQGVDFEPGRMVKEYQAIARRIVEEQGDDHKVRFALHGVHLGDYKPGRGYELNDGNWERCEASRSALAMYADTGNCAPSRQLTGSWGSRSLVNLRFVNPQAVAFAPVDEQRANAYFASGGGAGDRLHLTGKVVGAAWQDGVTAEGFGPELQNTRGIVLDVEIVSMEYLAPPCAYQTPSPKGCMTLKLRDRDR